MSKTDKTRPWWVKATEEPGRTCVPVHRHQRGECTLPDDPAEGLNWKADRCFWDQTIEFSYSGQARCGCAMCTGKFERRQERRRERREGRRRARDAEAGFRSGDIDEH